MLLRAHTLGMYLFKTPGNLRWQGWNLTALAQDWAAVEGPQTVELHHGWEQWWGDFAARSA